MEIKQTYLNALNDLNRDACLNLLIENLDQRKLSIEEAYQMIVGSLNQSVEPENHDIWQEHIKTQIVRTSLEILTPYVLKEVPNTNGKKVAVICPEGEYHELGARLVSDAIRKLGVESLYLGNSLPRHELFNLVLEYPLDAIALSVTNFYALSHVNQVIAEINAIRPKLPIILGGMAVAHNPSQLVGQNLVICHTLEDLKKAVEVL